MKKGSKTVISTLIGMAAGSVVAGTMTKVSSEKIIAEKDEIIKKMQIFYKIFDCWLQMRQEGRTLAEYFTKNNYKTVAIYGMKELGERLLDELKDSDISVLYAIDNNADQIDVNVDIVTPNDELKPVDVIVVTAVYYFDVISYTLSEKVDYPIVSLEDIVYEL